MHAFQCRSFIANVDVCYVWYLMYADMLEDTAILAVEFKLSIIVQVFEGNIIAVQQR